MIDGAMLGADAAAIRGGADRTLSVCYVSADYPVPGETAIGGIGAHTRALARAVASLGHRVTVLTQALGDAPGRFSDGAVDVEMLARTPPRMYKLGNVLPVMWLRRSYAVWRALRRLHRERRFDIVSFPDGYGEGYVHSFAPVARYAVQLFGPASVVQRWDGRRVAARLARAQAAIERRPAAHASLVVCATQRFADAMAAEWSLDASRIRIVRNPLDLERFLPGAPPRTRRVLFAGHLQRLKGLETLAEAMPAIVARHPDVEVVLVGNDTRSAPDGGSMRAHLERALTAQGVADRVAFLDPVPQHELVAHYQSCAVFVLPSTNDVYPNAVLEAMACGRPCIVTTGVGVSELIATADAGRVVPAGDADALAGAIGDLLALPVEELDRIGARARRVVEECCATATIARQTIDAYRAALVAPHGRRAGA
jgi:glycosyltransferase involved in cell wall biosynthesis